MSSRLRHVLFALAALGSACGGGDDLPTSPGSDTTLASAAIEPASLALAPGDTARLRVVLRNRSGATLPPQAVAWTSSDTAVARVDTAGLVTAAKPGAARVTASVGNKSAATDVQVTAPAGPQLVVTPAADSVDEGRAAQLTATIRNPDGSSQPADSVTWSPADSSMADVTPYGRVMGLRAGSTTVVARVGDLRDTVSLVVRPAAIQGVTLDGPSRDTLFIPKGERFPMLAQVFDTAGMRLPGRVLQWASVDPAVASVDSSGVVTALAPGLGGVRAETGGKSATYRFVVVDALAPTYRYSGCGAQLGTCATVVLSPMHLPVGGWRIVGYVESLAYDAPSRSGFISSLDRGEDRFFEGYTEYDCAGCNGDDRPSVVWARYVSVVDARCLQDPACAPDVLRLHGGTRWGYKVAQGPADAPYATPVVYETRAFGGWVWFGTFVPEGAWDPATPLTVAGSETYELTLQP